jgi:ribose 5-phosphate isomerase B
MHIAIGSDHAGFLLKREIIDLLDELGLAYKDFGAYDQAPTDYPDTGKAVAEAVAQGAFDRGVLLCGTGIGMDMVANKVRGIRSALCHDTFSAHTSREHNDANVLCMGERVVGRGLARDIARIWLTTEFSYQDRHQRRVDKITSAERVPPPQIPTMTPLHDR